MLDEAAVSQALTSAWYAPGNVMISNDEVAAFVKESEGRLVGVGSVDITRPMERHKKFVVVFMSSDLRPFACCPGYGQYRLRTVFFILSIRLVASWVCHFAPRLGIRVRLCPQRLAAHLSRSGCAGFPDLVIVGGHIGYP